MCRSRTSPAARNAARRGSTARCSSIPKSCARLDLNCVIHTHPPHLIALSVTGKPLRPHNQGGAVFADRLPVYDATMQLIRDAQMGAAVARAMGAHDAVLLKSHGLVLAGPTVEQAVVLCVMLEEAARIQLLVEAAGGAAPEFPPEDVAKLRESQLGWPMIKANFEYLARLATGAPLSEELARLPD